MLLSCLSVGAGGFIGAILRYLASVCCKQFATPIAITLSVNVVGSFVIMFLTAALARSFQLDSNLMLFLRIGLCGGFTTFSTFSAESLALIEQGQWPQAVAYALLSCTLCIAAAFAGEFAGNKVTLNTSA